MIADWHELMIPQYRAGFSWWEAWGPWWEACASGVFGISERDWLSNYRVLKIEGFGGRPLLVGGLGPGAPRLPLNPALPQHTMRPPRKQLHPRCSHAVDTHTTAQIAHSKKPSPRRPLAGESKRLSLSDIVRLRLNITGTYR